jgi:hypothetical protein
VSERLSVWTNDCDYVVAESADDADAITKERWPGHVGNADHWSECHGDGPFTLYGSGDRSTLGVTKTFAEWAAERGRGYFCTSEF